MLVIWIGEGTKVMRKARVSVESGEVKKVLGHHSIQVSSTLFFFRKAIILCLERIVIAISLLDLGTGSGEDGTVGMAGRERMYSG